MGFISKIFGDESSDIEDSSSSSGPAEAEKAVVKIVTKPAFDFDTGVIQDQMKNEVFREGFYLEQKKGDFEEQGLDPQFVKRPEEPDVESGDAWSGLYKIVDLEPESPAKITNNTEFKFFISNLDRLSNAVKVEEEPDLDDKTAVTDFDQVEQLDKNFIVHIYEEDNERIYYTDDYYYISEVKEYE
ncbi:MAG: hypothetical protein ABEJ83_03660 [Candidatus Nanohaloarchaea archaeon]